MWVSHSSLAVKRWRPYLQEAGLEVQGLVRYHYGREHGDSHGRYDAGEGVESYILIPRQESKPGCGMSVWNLKSTQVTHPSKQSLSWNLKFIQVIHFLQQNHTSLVTNCSIIRASRSHSYSNHHILLPGTLWLVTIMQKCIQLKFWSPQVFHTFNSVSKAKSQSLLLNLGQSFNSSEKKIKK